MNFTVSHRFRTKGGQADLQKEVGSNEFTSSTYLGGPGEWGGIEWETGRNTESAKKTNRIELWFWRTKRKLNDFEENKIWKANGGEIGDKKLGDNYPLF